MIGQNLAQYRVLERIGAGGMGEVYRAHDERLGRNVALKLLPAEQTGDSTARLRLLREARAAAALNHPHICVVHEVGESDSQTYIAMELIDGQPLAQRLAHGPLAAHDVVRYGIALADALAHAHQRGILHRDLKSSNVVITTGGHPKILDFGLAKRTVTDDSPDGQTVSRSLTEEGVVVGTFPYMAPEQLRGDAADARSDIWALGVMLYEMLAGTRPFHGRSRFELSAAILTQTPAALPSSLPAELKAVVFRCLEKDPALRYHQAGEVRAALEAVHSGTAIRRPQSLRRTTLTTLFALMTILAIAFVARELPRQTEQMPPAPAKSLAILPPAGQDLLISDGMLDGLIGEVARSGALRVISRTSAVKYRQTKKSMSEIARELGVDHLLESSVASSGNNLKLQMQLFALNPERPVWSRSFERPIDESASLLSEASRGIAGALGVTPPPAQQGRARNREAYELYLRGMHELNKFQRDAFPKGIAYLHQAVDKDPADGDAYAALATGYALIGHGSGAGSGPEGFAKARAAAQQALALDPDNAMAHAALAEVEAYLEWDWDGARKQFERALALNPNSDEMHRHYAWLHVLFWRYEEAFREMRIAQEIAPLRPVVFVELGWLHLYRGDYDIAIEQAKKGLELNPRAGNGLYVLGTAYAEKGMFAEAIEAHQKLPEILPPAKAALAMTYFKAGRRKEAEALIAEVAAMPGTEMRLARYYATTGDLDRAFHYAEKSFQARDWSFPWIFHERHYSHVRRDPRYAELMRRIGVPLPRE